VILLSSCYESHAQKQQSLYGELLGNGFFISANYDIDLTENKWGARVGLGAGVDGAFTVPVIVRKLIGKNGNYFEVGGGVTFLSNVNSLAGNDDLDASIAGTLSLQYRRQPVDGGLTWKAGLTPLFTKDLFIPLFPGVSVGYSW